MGLYVHRNQRLESRIRGFEGTCRRRILRIWWERTVTSREVWKRVGINDIAQEVKKRRWKWLGHVLRMKKDRHPYAALTWAQPGKRGGGRQLGGVPGDGQLRQRWRKQGRTGVNSGGLPRTGPDGGVLLTPSAPLEAKRIE